jgi:hypothetical protein
MTRYVLSAIAVFFIMSRLRPRGGKDEDDDEEADRSLRPEDSIEDMKGYLDRREKDFSSKLESLIDQTNKLTKDHDRIKSVIR